MTKSCYFCERNLPSVASNNKFVIVYKPQLVTLMNTNFHSTWMSNCCKNALEISKAIF